MVCTAGFTESGEWIHNYPVPFGRLGYGSQYGKYEWIELDPVKNPAISTSLAVFKPSKIRDFIWEEEAEKEWDKDKPSILQQGNLFEEKGAEFKVVRKLPFKFKYVFESDSGSVRTLMIEDWEVGALATKSRKSFPRATSNSSLKS